MPAASLDEIRGRVGTEVGVSDWLAIDQDRIDAFAEATEDKQFIHVDAEAAARTPFGGTVAHGFLSLSMLSRMGAEAMLVPETLRMGINYGLDRVRFIAPVRSGKRIRGRFVLDSVEDKAPGQILVRHSVTVEIEGEDKPALTAQWLALLFVQGD
ncbi:MAG TPA: MaoC family dehydratase [Sphingomicrobium sp.]|nr:MaoC family dehydratase [Sphingomicrobium sp.]